MKKTILFLLAVAVQVSLFAQPYFPEGTKWTEIRLDTMKYDSWYSQVGDEWVPNFETVEYYVKGEFVDEGDECYGTFKCVYTNSSEVSDSLALLLYENEHEWEGQKWIEATVPLFYEGHWFVWPGQAYQLNWHVGLELYCRTINNANTTGSYDTHTFGIIKEIKEGYFGGVRPLKYVDLNGVRIIQGIGVTEWNDGECLFGPIEPYMAYMTWKDDMVHYKERNYRSMLVHFERDGELLYDVWPQKGTNCIKSVYGSEDIAHSTTYDLSGRRTDKPTKGIYIQNGRTVVK